LAATLATAPLARHLAFLEQYRQADDRIVRAISAAPRDLKRTELLRRQNMRRAFAERFFELAQNTAGDPAAIDAIVDELTWVIIQCPDDPEGREAVERLIRGPIESARLGQACWQLDTAESPIAEPVFRAVLRRNAHAQARAQASLGLARTLRRRSEQGGTGPGRAWLAQASELVHEAESLLEDAVAHYGDQRIGRESLADIVRAELFELRSLGIGAEAPTIVGTDLQGRPMSLDEYRGKVVVLEFWGNWCSVCRESLPHERALVKRMEGRPFVLLGVNTDDAPAAAAEVERQQGIAARSWRDGGEVYGGRIAHRWNVKALPTTYILDHRGIIRYKLGPRPDGHDPVLEILDPAGEARDKWQLRAEQISAVVDELLAEMERPSDASSDLPPR
jgi:thiol-disulfide isomerase/thioredoxin